MTTTALREKRVAARVFIAGTEIETLESFSIGFQKLGITGKVRVSLGTTNINPAIQRFLGGAPIAIFVKDTELAGDRWVLLGMGVIRGIRVIRSGQTILEFDVGSEIELLSKVRFDVVSPNMGELKFGAPGITMLEIGGFSSMYHDSDLGQKVSSSLRRHRSLIKGILGYMEKWACTDSAEAVDEAAVARLEVDPRDYESSVNSLLRAMSGDPQFARSILDAVGQEIRRKMPVLARFLRGRGIEAGIAMAAWAGFLLKFHDLSKRFLEVPVIGFSLLAIGQNSLLNLLMQSVAARQSNLMDGLLKAMSTTRNEIYRFPFPIKVGEGRNVRIIDHIVVPAAVFQPVPWPNNLYRALSISLSGDLDILNLPTHAYVRVQHIPGILPIATYLVEIDQRRENNGQFQEANEPEKPTVSGVRVGTGGTGADMFFHGPGVIQVPIDPIFEIVLGAASGVNVAGLSDDEFSRLKERVHPHRGNILRMYANLVDEMIRAQSVVSVTTMPIPVVLGSGAIIPGSTNHYFRPIYTVVSYVPTGSGYSLTQTIQGIGYSVVSGDLEYSTLLRFGFGSEAPLQVYAERFGAVGLKLLASGDSPSSPARDLDIEPEDPYPKIRSEYPFVTLDDYWDWFNQTQGRSKIIRTQGKIVELLNRRAIKGLDVIARE